MGYKTAIIILDDKLLSKRRSKLPADIVLVQREYPGYNRSVNRIVRWVLDDRRDCQIVVTGGDDVYPDQTKRADEIAEEFIDHFGGTLGIMQPHGDDAHHRQNDGSYALDTAAWSPWMGREWCERAFMGLGPTHEGFYHYYGQTNLLQVAERLGVFWRRPDLIQRDDNWKRSARKHLGRPPYLKKAEEMGPADRALCKRLEAKGYPGCGLLPA